MSKKTEKELKEDLELQQREKFVAAVQEVEEKYGYCVVATLNYSQNGVYPTISVQKIKKEKEVKA